jgi:hypothetical protein
MTWNDDDKEFIIEAIVEGLSNEEIVEMLPHVSIGSIVAFRAHVTRGTYDQPPVGAGIRIRIDSF